MPLSDFLSPEAIVPALKCNSKKQALQELAQRAAALTGLGEREIFETLLQRERLGSTGIGRCIAIPHGKLAKLDQFLVCSLGSKNPLILKRSTVSPWTWSSSFWRQRRRVPTI